MIIKIEIIISVDLKLFKVLLRKSMTITKLRDKSNTSQIYFNHAEVPV
jgi:hypothetical protein